VVVAEHSRPVKGRFVEILGHFNPRSKEFVVKEDRVKHWLSVGAEASPRVHNLLITNKVIDGKKIKNSTMKKKEEGGVAAPKEEVKTEKGKEETPTKEEEKTEEVPEKKEEPKEVDNEKKDK
jgi:small subunit ribosomal protein S16